MVKILPRGRCLQQQRRGEAWLPKDSSKNSISSLQYQRTWKQVAVWANNDTATFNNLRDSGYVEVLVLAYRSSVPENMVMAAPTAYLSTNQQGFYMTGGAMNATQNRDVAVNLSLTSATRLAFTADTVTINSGIKWYLAAR